MKKYIFPWLNNSLEITDPTITIDPKLRNIDTVAMTITAYIFLEVPDSKFGIVLNDIAVDSLSYDGATLMQKVLVKLQEYEV